MRHHCDTSVAWGEQHDHTGLAGGSSSPGLTHSQAEPALCVRVVWPCFSCQRGAMGFVSILSREEHSLYILPWTSSWPTLCHLLGVPASLLWLPCRVSPQRRDPDTCRDTASLRTAEKVRLGITHPSTLGFSLQLCSGILCCGTCGCLCPSYQHFPLPLLLCPSLALGARVCGEPRAQ